jgi:protease PrsW
MKIIISLAPVLIFVFFLIFIDSFKLIRLKTILICFFWGMLSAGIAYVLNNFLYQHCGLSPVTMSKYAAPFIEEGIKVLILLVLIGMNRIAFVIDGIIYAFSIGAGFSVIENIYYLHKLPVDLIMVWIMRGFGTALMHGGATTLFAVFVMIQVNRSRSLLYGYVLGLFAAIVLHALYNHFLIDPLYSTLFIVLVWPLALLFTFQYSENSIRKGLYNEFDSELELLIKFKRREFRNTRAGQYINKLRDSFPKEVLFDMLNYIKLYAEISIHAKRNLMLKEAGLAFEPDKEFNIKLLNLKELEKNIGKTGLIAMSPIMKIRKKDLWKLNIQ